MNPCDPMPELLEAYWPNERITELFSELRQAAQIDQILVKGQAVSGTPPAKPGLDEVESLCRDRSIAMAQIRYRVDGQAWCDTLFPGPEMTRIVRMKSLRESSQRQ